MSQLFDSPCKPIHKWMGSKLSFRREIIDEINGSGYTGTYFEPFVGCGSVLLGLLPGRAVISDLNQQLINVWRWLQRAPNLLIDEYKRIDRETIAEAYYYELRDEHNKYKRERSETVTAAAVFIWITRHSFNGLYRTRKDGTFNANWNKQEHAAIPDFDNWLKIGRYLDSRGVRILNEDFSTVVKMAKMGDLVYADPPYAVGTGDTAHSRPVYGGFDIDSDSVRVVRALEDCPAYVIASNNDNDVVRRLYTEDKWRYKEVNVRRAFHGSRGKINYNRRAELVLIKR